MNYSPGHRTGIASRDPNRSLPPTICQATIDPIDNKHHEYPSTRVFIVRANQVVNFNEICSLRFGVRLHLNICKIHVTYEQIVKLKSGLCYRWFLRCFYRGILLTTNTFTYMCTFMACSPMQIFNQQLDYSSCDY